MIYLNTIAKNKHSAPVAKALGMRADQASTLTRDPGPRSATPASTPLYPRALKLLQGFGVMLFLWALHALAQQTQSVTLAWDPNPADPWIVGYRVYYGTASRGYTITNQVGKVARAVISGLRSGTTYYFAVTAYGTNNLDSDFSDELSCQVPASAGVPLDPVITWTPPGDLVYGTPLSGTQLNASANVPGTFIYRPPADVVLSAGTGQTLTAVFTPSDTTNYRTCTNAVTLNVLPVPLTTTPKQGSLPATAEPPPLTASDSGSAADGTSGKITAAATPTTTTGTGSPDAGTPARQAYKIEGIPPGLTLNDPNGPAALTLWGTVGASLTVQCATNRDPPYDWLTLTNLPLTDPAYSEADLPSSQSSLIALYRAFTPARQVWADPDLGRHALKLYRVIMPYDYAILASQVLRPKGYATRLIAVRMPGLAYQAVCYVIVEKAYLHYDQRTFFINLEKSGPTIREIAARVAASLNENWTSASEFTYAAGVKQMVATVVKTEPPESDPLPGTTRRSITIGF